MSAMATQGKILILLKILVALQAAPTAKVANSGYIILVFVFLSVMAAVVKMRSNSRRISFIDKFFVFFIYFLLFVWTVGGLPLFS